MKNFSEKTLNDYFYLIPNAYFELASVRADSNANIENVEFLLNKAKSYKGYLLEMKLHFRIHHAMNILTQRKLNSPNLPTI